MAIIERNERYDLSGVHFSDEFTGKTGNRFLARLKLSALPDCRERTTIVQCPYFTVQAARLDASDAEAFTEIERKDNIAIYADEDGFIDVLEVSAQFQSPFDSSPRTLVVDLLPTKFDARESGAYIYYDGLKLSWIYDGKIANCDHSFGKLVSNDAPVFVADGVDCAFALDPEAVVKNEVLCKQDKSFNFYSPEGYNAWAGDAVNFYRDGVYHLLYLHDRHHHGSRWGGGAHTMRHFTTTDFIDWIEQPTLVNLTEDWQSVGTGTMFFQDGKFYFAHGWHTSRMIPHKNTVSYLMESRTDGKTVSPVSDEERAKTGLYPSGGTFVYSENGINFTPSKTTFHIAENPSVYTDENGELIMFAGYGKGGIWRAKTIDGEWRLDVETAMPASILNPSTECPSRFSVNGRDYLVMGGSGYWRTDEKGVYRDEAIKGYDVYDGLSYPMVAKTDDGRLILAGWIRGKEWGSVIIHRELVPDGDGRLTMKWLSELTPDITKLERLGTGLAFGLDERQSYYFEWDVDAGADTVVRASFDGKCGGAVLTIDARRQTIQISDDESELLPLYVTASAGEKNAHPHHGGHNFAIGRVDTVDRPYSVKMQVYYEPKLDGVLIDCEVGGKRTIVSNRNGQRFSSVSFSVNDGAISKVHAYKLNY